MEERELKGIATEEKIEGGRSETSRRKGNRKIRKQSKERVKEKSRIRGK